MNLQIQQLIDTVGTDVSGKWMAVDKVEKFAELIVKECAQVADAERPSLLGCGYITKTTGMRIKEHFGVEE